MTRRQGRARSPARRGPAAPDWTALARAALEARRHAYAPYSEFRVGAALLAGSGTVYPGSNVENASYGLCICAERTAVVRAVTAGERSLAALVVATQSQPPAPPCGLCLQTLAEFTPDLPILLINPRRDRVETSLGALFPGAFTGALLRS